MSIRGELAMSRKSLTGHESHAAGCASREGQGRWESMQGGIRSDGACAYAHAHAHASGWRDGASGWTRVRAITDIFSTALRAVEAHSLTAREAASLLEHKHE